MYTLKTELNLTLDETIVRLTSALSEEGLSIISDINIQTIISTNLKDELWPYRILGTCAPGLLNSLIGIEDEIGALLPCNIVVQEYDGRTHIGFMDPVSVLGLANQPAINDIALQVRNIMRRVLDRIQG